MQGMFMGRKVITGTSELSQSTKSCKNMYDNQELKRDAKRRHAEQKVEWETQQKEDQNQKKKERRGVQNESCSKKRNEMHEPREALQFNICEKQFSRKEFLDRHTFNVHLKQRQFTCQHCKKT